jgi:hypothetical protein
VVDLLTTLGGETLKVKTLTENVSFYGQKKGAVIEVSETNAKHYIKLGVAEEVKPAPKKPTQKKTTTKKTEEK